MKLEPKAKPVRIRILSGGEEHSSIESLRNNYSLTDILPLARDGRLHKWLLRVGETKAAEDAYILIGSNTYANSRDMVALTASIFNTPAKNIEDLQKLWQKKYPKSLLNYIKTYGGAFSNISSAREAYESFNGDNTGIKLEKWQYIFETTLRKMPISAVLEDFKQFKDIKPMDSIVWSKVLQYHAANASDKDLYLIAQAAYNGNDPYLKDKAVEWYQKSARSYIKAKEWVNKNVKRLDPKEKELFDSFEKNPVKFNKIYFDDTYPQDLILFLNTLNRVFLENEQPTNQEIIGRGKFTKYLFILDKLYYLNHSNRKEKCILTLKQLPNNYYTEPYFRNYETLQKIINSLEKEEPIFGVQLSKLSYREIILFIAGLAKSELENEK